MGKTTLEALEELDRAGRQFFTVLFEPLDTLLAWLDRVMFRG